MKIGVVFHGNILAGGCFQQSLNAVRLISKENGLYEFVYYTPDKGNLLSAAKYGIKAKTFDFGRKQRLIHKLRKQISLNRILSKFALFNPIDSVFEKDEVDLLYFTSPSPICLFLERLNYVLTHWDLCHLEHVEFPEVRQCFEFEARENFAKNALAKAVAVIAVSSYAKRSLEKKYCLDENRVHTLSIAPAFRSYDSNDSSFNPRKEAQIPEGAQYIFYPAQFWAHKNHRLIIDSLALLRSKNQEVYAIFCGSDCGNLPIVLNMAKNKGVGDLVKYLGFVPDKHMPALYKQSIALVMPSYFGPVNMPPLEAFEFETPVIVSDLEGIRDQVMDAALLISPDEPESLCNAIIKLVREPKMRDSLIKKGKTRLQDFSDEDRLDTLKNIFSAYDRKRLTWSIK